MFAHPDAAVVSRVRRGPAPGIALSSSASAVLRRSAPPMPGHRDPRRARARPHEVLRYREKLGMTHLIARTQVPGADLSERLAALDALASLGLSA
jgi:hypothetical protein